MKRESFRSRLGFLLVSAGCAIGIGNVWRFPYVTGKNGGGYFVLFYILCLLIMGVPVLTMELAVGRASHKSAILAYKTLEKPKSKWHIHGWFCLIGCYLLMMYYTTVSGWMVSYFGRFLTGKFYSGMPAEDASAVFGQLLSDPVEMGILAVAIVIVGFIVCSFGLQKGLERVSKVMMIALLALILILAGHSLTLSGAAEGMKFYLLPSMDSIRENGLRSLITDAMNQAFFTLSLGIAAMEIFGSYMSDDHTLAGESIRICALDTFVALMAGTIIFPACFSYGVAPDNGPSLLFVTLPQVFVNMSGGRFWGTLFFLFMMFASMSTVLAVFENILAVCMDTFGWSRKKAVFINGVLLMLLSLPCVFGYNIWSDFHPILGKDVLDSEDFLVSNLLLPIGSLVYLLFCVMKWGWGFDKYLAEVNKGTGIKLSPKLKPYFQWVLPILIVIILVLWILASCIRIVPQAYAIVLERLGAYQATWGTGLHFKIPIFDRVARRVDLKEQVVDFAPQPVITKDNVTMQIDTVVFFQITDPKLFAYGVVNPLMAIENLTATTLRNIIGDLELDETLTSREIINTKMQAALDIATDPWGIKVNRVLSLIHI